MMLFPIGKGAKHRWKELETKGAAPEGRFHHGMNYYEKGNYVIIYGGRRIANPEPSLMKTGTKPSEFVDQVALLRVDSLEWFEVRYKQSNKMINSFPQLYNFSAALIDDQIVVFGGMKGAYMQSKELYSIYLEDFRTIYNETAEDTGDGSYKSPSERDGYQDASLSNFTKSDPSLVQSARSLTETSSEEGASFNGEDSEFRIKETKHVKKK